MSIKDVHLLMLISFTVIIFAQMFSSNPMACSLPSLGIECTMSNEYDSSIIPTNSCEFTRGIGNRPNLISISSPNLTYLHIRARPSTVVEEGLVFYIKHVRTHSATESIWHFKFTMNLQQGSVTEVPEFSITADDLSSSSIQDLYICQLPLRRTSSSSCDDVSCCVCSAAAGVLVCDGCMMYESKEPHHNSHSTSQPLPTPMALESTLTPATWRAKVKISFHDPDTIIAVFERAPMFKPVTFSKYIIELFQFNGKEFSEVRNERYVLEIESKFYQKHMSDTCIQHANTERRLCKQPDKGGEDEDTTMCMMCQSFTNLKPGKYMVKARAEDDNDNDYILCYGNNACFPTKSNNITIPAEKDVTSVIIICTLSSIIAIVLTVCILYNYCKPPVDPLSIIPRKAILVTYTENSLIKIVLQNFADFAKESLLLHELFIIDARSAGEIEVTRDDDSNWYLNQCRNADKIILVCTRDACNLYNNLASVNQASTSSPKTIYRNILENAQKEEFKHKRVYCRFRFTPSEYEFRLSYKDKKPVVVLMDKLKVFFFEIHDSDKKLKSDAICYWNKETQLARKLEQSIDAIENEGSCGKSYEHAPISSGRISASDSERNFTVSIPARDASSNLQTQRSNHTSSSDFVPFDTALGLLSDNNHVVLQMDSADESTE